MRTLHLAILDDGQTQNVIKVEVKDNLSDIEKHVQDSYNL